MKVYFLFLCLWSQTAKSYEVNSAHGVYYKRIFKNNFFRFYFCQYLKQLKIVTHFSSSSSFQHCQILYERHFFFYNEINSPEFNVLVSASISSFFEIPLSLRSRLIPILLLLLPLLPRLVCSSSEWSLLSDALFEDCFDSEFTLSFSSEMSRRTIWEFNSKNYLKFCVQGWMEAIDDTRK